MLILLPFIILAYLLGSIPMGILVARLFGLADPRSTGSGNTGATNLFRAGGIKVGLLTFLADFSKGLIPTLLASFYFSDNPWASSIVAFACVVGHCHSIFLKLSGGKGVATTAGVMLVLAPQATAIGFVIWVIAFAVNRTASLAAAIALISSIIVMSQLKTDWTVVTVAVVSVLLIIRRHENNWNDLINNKERHF
jgi:glycerol-3-phosphate acyltransferase PlsY